MFTTAEFKNRLKQQPFKPFRIVTSSGQSYEVPHPDLLLIGVNELVVGAASKQDPSVFENVNRVAIVHVTALEDLPARTSRNSKGNGKKKK